MQFDLFCKMVRRIIDLDSSSEEVASLQRKRQQDCTRVANEEVAKKRQRDCTRVDKDTLGDNEAGQAVEADPADETGSNSSDDSGWGTMLSPGWERFSSWKRFAEHRASQRSPAAISPTQPDALYFIVGSSQSFHLQSLDLVHV